MIFSQDDDKFAAYNFLSVSCSFWWSPSWALLSSLPKAGLSYCMPIGYPAVSDSEYSDAYILCSTLDYMLIEHVAFTNKRILGAGLQTCQTT
jgi:hypothetical protein